MKVKHFVCALISNMYVWWSIYIHSIQYCHVQIQTWYNWLAKLGFSSDLKQGTKQPRHKLYTPATKVYPLHKDWSDTCMCQYNYITKNNKVSECPMETMNFRLSGVPTSLNSSWPQVWRTDTDNNTHLPKRCVTVFSNLCLAEDYVMTINHPNWSCMPGSPSKEPQDR